MGSSIDGGTTGTMGSGGIGTIAKLKNEGGDIEAEEEEEEELMYEDQKVKTKVVPANCGTNDFNGSAASTSHCTEGIYSVKMVVAPHRTKGHLVVLTMLAVVFIIGFVVLLNIQSGSQCNIFETAFAIALLLDFCIVQPLVMLLIYLFRWLESNEDNEMWCELHPFDGAERDM